MVALAIGAVVIVVAYNAIHLMVLSEQSTDRDASRALAEALVMETLLQDVRSARSVAPAGTGYRITRNVVVGGRIAEDPVVVTWEVIDGPKVRRQVGSDRPQVFDFSTLIRPEDPPFKFQLERTPDVIFQP
jgi:hypothetical protein